MGDITNSTPETLRWGIIGCGLISSWFVADIVLPRSSAPTKHIVQAVGSSSKSKAQAFVEKHCPAATPTLYESYSGVYTDPDVDVVYLGTPHALHYQNALDAINAGKNVLCEKPLTINAKQADALIAAARAKNVFFMEAVWTRFYPLVKKLGELLHTEKVIGDISRAFIDFGLDMPISKLPPSARTADPALGAGALLDVGIYTLTWAAVIFDQHPVQKASGQEPLVASSMSLTGGADDITSVILNYPALHAHAICTCSMNCRSGPEFARVEGSLGTISVGGPAASKPEYLIVKKKDGQEEKLEFKFEGWGFFYEQDAIAECLAKGEKECSVMPLDETSRIMRLMDQIRAANGLKYVQDDEF
ncbi:hypothetical protein BP5796_05048 [Coleophoma crateriformis]|uniref:D-xylose 1-dehydrogenase (NADP(+), D-xylono-1,5-lactone-forming) n=1 Tax=Coleophoma crateriformis TaxID=565419 RepID=A0A3D8S2G4_9HELO|nr:hypothetical protein BP5796_05048 [Coleophoma crateriformis]